MILKIEFENFFSIRDRVRIDFRAASINTALTRELSHNVMEWKGVPILKTIGLFGPNASGKSNILKAINFCCRMILDSHLYNEGVTFKFEPFKFDGWQNKPSKFLIDFVCEDVEYEYAFELTRERIISESLYHYPVGRRAKIYVRDADGKYSFGTGDRGNSRRQDFGNYGRRRNKRKCGIRLRYSDFGRRSVRIRRRRRT